MTIPASKQVELEGYKKIEDINTLQGMIEIVDKLKGGVPKGVDYRLVFIEYLQNWDDYLDGRVYVSYNRPYTEEEAIDTKVRTLKFLLGNSKNVTESHKKLALQSEEKTRRLEAELKELNE